MSAKKDRDIPAQRDPSETHHYHVFMGGQQLVVVRHANVWRPPTDVMEDDDRLLVVVEIAGMKSGDFNVAISAQRLVISGTRSVREQSCTAYHQLEIRYGEFRTEISLPWPVDEEGVTARYEDGFLRVELPRAKPESVRVIAVNKTDE